MNRRRFLTDLAFGTATLAAAAGWAVLQKPAEPIGWRKVHAAATPDPLSHLAGDVAPARPQASPTECHLSGKVAPPIAPGYVGTPTPKK